MCDVSEFTIFTRYVFVWKVLSIQRTFQALIAHHRSCSAGHAWGASDGRCRGGGGRGRWHVDGYVQAGRTARHAVGIHCDVLDF